MSFNFLVSEIKEKQENMRNIFHNLSSAEKKKINSIAYEKKSWRHDTR